MNKIRRLLHALKYTGEFDKALNLYNPLSNESVRKNKIRKIKWAFVENNWNPDEYFLFKYEHLSNLGKKQFVCQNEGFQFRKLANTENVHRLFLDKSLTYDRFKQYFGRDVVKSDDDIVKLKRFIAKHPRCIIKSLNDSCGNGIHITNCVDFDSWYSSIKKEYPKGFLVEELIQQSNSLAQFHPQSVNTVRLTTFKYGEVIELIKRPFIRFGQGDAIVDNGAKGGIIASIDFDSGIITSAIDELGHYYIIHPDTKKTIIGYQIPRWQEAKEFAVELMRVIPESRYIGWDLALTENGWVMVEGNSKGLFVGFQLPNQKGFRDEYNDMKRKLNINLK